MALLRISVAIMAHPARKRFIPNLRRRLPGATVVWDERENRWDTGRRSLLAHDPDADRHIVIQDDALLCRGFLRAAKEALAHVPVENPVSFYTGKTRPYGPAVTRAVRQARNADKNWLAMRGPIWGPAVALPVDAIEPMVAACDAYSDPRYDGRMTAYFAERGIACWYSLPSLVDHRVGPESPSLIPGRGAGASRVAHDWIGNRSPLKIDWSGGAYGVTGDLSDPWRVTANGWACGSCGVENESLTQTIAHVSAAHDGPDKIDLLATDKDSLAYFSDLWADLPLSIRGKFWATVQASVPADAYKIRRMKAKRLLSRHNTFTLCGREADFPLVGRRPVMALDGARQLHRLADSLTELGIPIVEEKHG